MKNRGEKHWKKMLYVWLKHSGIRMVRQLSHWNITWTQRIVLCMVLDNCQRQEKQRHKRNESSLPMTITMNLLKERRTLLKMMNKTIFRTLQQRSYNVTNIYFFTGQHLFPITILRANVMQEVNGSTQGPKKMVQDHCSLCTNSSNKINEKPRISKRHFVYGCPGRNAKHRRRYITNKESYFWRQQLTS